MYNEPWTFVSPGVSSPKLTNCTFVANSATDITSRGGAIYGGASQSLTNCILWANSAGGARQADENPGSITATYSDIQDGFTGTAIISVDPLFVRNPSAGPDAKWGTVDDDYGDLRLQACSPVVDMGNNNDPSLAGVTTDLGGGSRFLDVPSTPDAGVGARARRRHWGVRGRACALC